MALQQGNLSFLVSLSASQACHREVRCLTAPRMLRLSLPRGKKEAAFTLWEAITPSSALS